jgi:flagellar basal-body rod protein FlgC
MSILSSLRIAAGAMRAQRARMDIITSNIANIDSTRTPGGSAYRRRQVVFTSMPGGLRQFFALLRHADQPDFGRLAMSGVGVQRIAVDQSPLKQVYDPQHPDADPVTGIVEYPNVDLVTEMTDMIAATRSYEASVTALNAAKTMALRALDIGRG